MSSAVTIRIAMDTPGERLKWARENAGYKSAESFAHEIDIPPVTYRAHERGARGLSEPVAKRYSTELHCNWVWVMTGEGPRFMAHVSLPPAANAPKSRGENVHPIRPGSRDIPVIDYITAGSWGDINDAFELHDGMGTVPTNLPVSEHTFALEIEGTSMQDEFLEGDQIIIDPEVTPEPGEYVVAKLDTEAKATFKKYRPRGDDERGIPIIDLVPLNDDWPVLTISAKNPGHIVGTMVEQRRRRRR